MSGGIYSAHLPSRNLGRQASITALLAWGGVGHGGSGSFCQKLGRGTNGVVPHATQLGRLPACSVAWEGGQDIGVLYSMFTVVCVAVAVSPSPSWAGQGGEAAVSRPPNLFGPGYGVKAKGRHVAGGGVSVAVGRQGKLNVLGC